jgi:hypothetical protein
MLVRAARGKGLDRGPHPGRVALHAVAPAPFASETGIPAKKGMLCRVAGIYT